MTRRSFFSLQEPPAGTASSSNNCWKRFTFALWTFLCVLFLVLVVFVLTSFWLSCSLVTYAKKPLIEAGIFELMHKFYCSAENSFEPKLCDSYKCRIAAKAINHSIRAQLNPCEDFHNYVCSRWIKGHSKRPTNLFIEEAKRNNLSVARKLANVPIRAGTQTPFDKAGYLFQSCSALQNENHQFEKVVRDDVVSFLREHQALMQPGCDVNVVRLILDFAFNYQLPTIFEIGVVTDLNSISRKENFLYLRFSIPPYLFENDAEDIDEHLNWLGLNSYQSRDVAPSIKYTHTLLSDLVKRLHNEEKSQGGKKPKQYRLSELQKIINSSGHAWSEYMNATTDGLLPHSCNVEISNASKTFLIHAFRKIRECDLGLWISFQVSRNLRQRLTLKSHLLHRKDSAAQEHCFRLTMQVMHTAAYSEHYCSEVTNITVSQAQGMVHRIQASLRAEIAQSAWIDDNTKNTAQRKLSSMQKVVGNEICAKNTKFLDHFYEPLKLERPSFVSNWLSALKFETRRLLRWYGRQRPSINFDEYMSMTQGAYNPKHNSMKLYVNLLQPPFYGVIPAIDYGSAGHFAGHEMMHAFDVGAKRRDENNVEREWWSEISNEEYNRRVVDIRKLYEPNSDPRCSVHDKDSELLADFAALHAVYKAYYQVPESAVKLKILPDLSSDMLFFISYCYKWCSTSPAGCRYPEYRDRCNVPLQHMSEFSAAFKCEEGEIMNPSKKVTFW
uniref:Putative m13 family peptidase n=1 Tax=Rhipicephalus pulchellus TaxID=72859 RepID=L7M9A0_RHIPC